MITFVEASITSLSIHQIGNKHAGGALSLSDKPILLKDEILEMLLKEFFIAPFEKTSEWFQFSHPNNDLDLNELYHFAGKTFKIPESAHNNSMEIAKHLFAKSDHPKIKPGELYVALFDDLLVNGKLEQAIGIFKSEIKESYLAVDKDSTGFEIRYEEQGINIKKLDKGCLIINSDAAEGYKIAVIDQTNRTEAAYWMDEFLKLSVKNDEYTQTHNTLSIFKKFVTEKMDEEFDLSRTDKIDLLNRSITYFKKKEDFNLNEFSNDVISNGKGITMFKNFKQEYENEFKTEISDNFQIASAAVKKQAKAFKSVLKLDKNFHIYVHGNNDLIEKGFDEEKKMSYYKIYFWEES